MSIIKFFGDYWLFQFIIEPLMKYMRRYYAAEMLSRLNDPVKLRCDAVGITIPFPQRDIHIPSQPILANGHN